MRMAIVIDAIIYSGVITPWERGRKSFILSCRVVEPLWDSKERWGAAKTKVGCGFEGEILRCSHTQGRSRRPPLSSVPPFSCWFIAVARKVFSFFRPPSSKSFLPLGIDIAVQTCGVEHHHQHSHAESSKDAGRPNFALARFQAIPRPLPDWHTNSWRPLHTQ